MADDNNTGDDGEEKTAGQLAEVLGDALPDITGLNLPPVVRKSFWKAVARLVTGGFDIGGAWLDAKAQNIRVEGSAKDVVTMAAAKAASSQFQRNEELGERAVMHFASKIVREQVNLEETLKIAKEDLQAAPPEGDAKKEIDEDWLNQFADIAAKVSNEDMKRHLGKILAGEIKNPGSFSAATILTLTTISREEAKLFEKLCNVSMSLGGVQVLCTPYGDPGNNALRPLGLGYDVLCHLRVAGLLLPDITSQTTFDEVIYRIPWDFCGRLAVFRTLEGDPPIFGKHKTVLFSRAGAELRNIIPMKPNPAYVECLQKMLREKYKSEMVYFRNDGTTVVAGKE
ncbi:MAG: DUF2806 domain-containing protein [Rhodospirillales bacterium]|nr:DUF2806 domain-containing protein [Rhodospirillales bacterium]